MLDRVSINEYNGATNTINDVEYYELIRDTCCQIFDVLKDHCGPYATDALIITDNDKNLKERHYAIFTKDGINIVRSIEFVSPIQRHIQSLIAYIGERVDSLSHDGTTTSMMLFTVIVKLFMDLIIDSKLNKKSIDRRPLKSSILKSLFRLITRLEEDVITVDRFAKEFKLTKLDAVRFIAHHQAMLSSKGDIELANAITEVVETLPVELYGLFTVSQSGLETEKRFTVVKEDFNYRLPVHCNMDDMNYNMGTEYLSEKCDIIVSEDDLKPGNMALEIIVNHIGKFRNDAFPVKIECEDVDLNTGTLVVKDEQNKLSNLPLGSTFQLTVNNNPLNDGIWIYNGLDMPLTRPVKQKDLIIIAKSLDENLMREIQKINRRSLNKIIVFTMSTPNPYSSKCTVLQALVATAGVYFLSDHLQDSSKNYLIEDAKIHFKNRRLYVSNLYQKDGTNYHPFFNNPDAFEPYTSIVSDIKAYLDNCTSGKIRIESANDKARYEDYVEIYRRMICSEVRQLQISGMTHDVLADRDVLQDSFGAVLSSLENGFILDGYLKLNYYLRDIGSLDIIKNSFMEIMIATHHQSEDTINNILSSIPWVNNNPYYFYPVDGSLTDFKKCTFQIENLEMADKLASVGVKPFKTAVFNEDGNEVAFVMQPADTYRELFRRLSDLLPKLVNTNRAIVPGTVNESSRK